MPRRLTHEEQIQHIAELEKKIARLKQAQEALQESNDDLNSEVQQKTSELKSSQELNHTVLNTMQDSICLINTNDFSIVNFNNHFIKQYEGQQQAFFGQPCYKVIMGQNKPCSSSPDNPCPILTTLRSGQATFAEHTKTSDSGEKSYLEVATLPVKDKDGIISQVVHVIRNVSHRRQVEEEFKKAKDIAEAANQSKIDFLANMSHELRTPMNVIIGMNQLALNSCHLSEQRNYLTTVQQSAEALHSLLNDILDFSKIEAGQLDLDDRPFDLVNVMKSITSNLGMKAQEKGYQLTYDLPPRIHAPLIGDKFRLRQILLNLTSNAIKFTESGQVHIGAKIISESEKSLLLQFEVADTGPGIPEKIRKQIFESFTQADSSVTRVYGGTGLGLAICKEIAKLLGGEIWVKSKEGQGSVFYFTATFQKGEEATKSFTAPEVQTTKTASLYRLKILLVEDNQFNRDLARIILEQQGHTIFQAIDGVEALETLAENSIDVILMDIQMPRMDGITATKLIRQCELNHTPSTNDAWHDILQELQGQIKGKHIPIIAMTAHAMAKDRERCLASGMDNYVTKPFQPEEIFELLEQIVDKRHMITNDNCLMNKQGHNKPHPPLGIEHVREHLNRSYYLSSKNIDSLQNSVKDNLLSELTKAEDALANNNLKALSLAAQQLKEALRSAGLDHWVALAHRLECHKVRAGEDVSQALAEQVRYLRQKLPSLF